MAIDELIERWVRPEIRAIDAYHVPEAEGLIKLDAMENPYTWDEAMRRQWLELLHGTDVNRYPHPQAPALKQALRRAMSIPGEAEVILGNGSDELIQMLAMTVGGPGRVVMSVEPSFVMYRMIAAFTGMQYVGVPLREEDFALDFDALLAAVEQHQPALLFLAYPNNPTGNLFDPVQIEQLLEQVPGVLVVDEAYAPFTDASYMARVGAHPRLLVMRTVSKMGLAGLRLGLLTGPVAWLEQIEKTRLPYNINVLTQVSAEFALRHAAVFRQQTEAIRSEREMLYRALVGLEGVRAYPSEANFILLRLADGEALRVHAGLRQQGILVKNLHGSHSMLQECLRLTVGTPDQNRILLEALRSLL